MNGEVSYLHYEILNDQLYQEGKSEGSFINVIEKFGLITDPNDPNSGKHTIDELKVQRSIKNFKALDQVFSMEVELSPARDILVKFKQGEFNSGILFHLLLKLIKSGDFQALTSVADEFGNENARERTTFYSSMCSILIRDIFDSKEPESCNHQNMTSIQKLAIAQITGKASPQELLKRVQDWGYETENIFEIQRLIDANLPDYFIQRRLLNNDQDDDDGSLNIVEAFKTFKILKQFITLFNYHFYITGQDQYNSQTGYNMIEIQKYALDLFSANRSYHRALKNLFAKILSYIEHPDMALDMFGQFTSEETEVIKRDPGFQVNVFSRVTLLIEKMQVEIIQNTYPEKEDLVNHFSQLFDRTFYLNLLNKYGNHDGKHFVEYLAIIVGLRDDDGTILTELQQKFLL